MRFGFCWEGCGEGMSWLRLSRGLGVDWFRASWVVWGMLSNSVLASDSAMMKYIM